MNNELKIFLLISSILIFCVTVFLILIFSHIYKRKQKHITETVELKNKFDATLLQTQIEIQEQTLKTISQEIHDNIGQILSLTKLTLSQVDVVKENNIEKLNTSKTLLNKAIIDLKDLSNSLNTDSIEAMGLLKAIEYEIELINKTGIIAELIVTGTIEKLNPKTELILFRMVQECLNNAIKHAKAKNIIIDAVYNNNSFELAIKDNGVGFDINKINSKGLGLKNMQTRVKVINATLHLSSSIDGTQILITIPKIQTTWQ